MGWQREGDGALRLSGAMAVSASQSVGVGALRGDGMCIEARNGTVPLAGQVSPSAGWGLWGQCGKLCASGRHLVIQYLLGARNTGKQNKQLGR